MKIAIESKALDWFNVAEVGEFESFDQTDISAVIHSNAYDFLIAYAEDSTQGLLLYQHQKPQLKASKKPKYLQHQIDISGFIKQQGHSFPASKKTLFSQAVGRKTQRVIDATGGWLGDTLLMCSQNYSVTVLERHWLLQGFIAEACQRLEYSSWLNTHKAPLPNLVKKDAIDFFNPEENTTDCIADCIFIDPMFPPKLKRSAAVRKSMQVLHELIGQDADVEQLFAAALQSNVRRIVVKRPDYATPLGINSLQPTETLSGKLVRYDVYIR